jgi:HD-GYP domain-containing protein (c-di-GMP phosphodiesterase class II)
MPDEYREDLDKKVHRFLAGFYQVSFMSELYEIQNKVFNEPIANLVQEMLAIMPELGEIAIQELDGHLIFNGRRLKSDAAAFMRHKQLVEWLSGHQIRAIIFRGTLDETQWRLLLNDISKTSRVAPDAYEQLVDALRRDGLTAVEVTRKEGTLARAQVRRIELNRRHFALQAFGRTAAILKLWVTYDGPQTHREYLFTKLHRTVQDLVSVCLREDWKYIGFVNNKIETDDLFHNAANVAIISIAMGIRAGLRRPQLLDLGLSALSRNLGVAYLPGELRDKRGAYNAEERKAASKHPLLGIRSILGSRQYHEGLLKRILVMWEHRRADIDTTHPYTRIVAVAERFNALTRHRTYRYAYLPDAAIYEILKMGGRVLDADAVHLLVYTVGLYPPGTLVRLSSGEQAVVFHPNPDRVRFREPIVRLVRDASGQGVWPPPIADLSTSIPARRIVGSLDPAEHGISVARVLAEEEPGPQAAKPQVFA